MHGYLFCVLIIQNFQRVPAWHLKRLLRLAPRVLDSSRRLFQIAADSG